MKSNFDFSLTSHNSFSVDSICPKIYFPSSIEELKDLPDLSTEPFYILGEGSNTLFVEQSTPVIIKPIFNGINITESENEFIIEVGASENWHHLVCLCVEKQICGLENLALIPGSVGAAPVQNIGAYGVEISSYCTTVKWFEFKSKKVIDLSNAQCRFGYRDSIFKNELYNKGIIIGVTFSLPKSWQPINNYHGLNKLNENATAKEIMDTVISLRESKLPDPKKLPNAGSFFKNPLVSEEIYLALKAMYPTLPSYSQPDSSVKLAAGWLIEQSGLKGFEQNGVGVHKNQALVLVNHNSKNGGDILSLAKFVQRKVKEKFDIHIQTEVRLVTHNGEFPIDELT